MTRLFALLLSLLPTGLLAEGSFPTITVDDLNGRSVTLPQGLPGDPTIVFIAYERDHQDMIDAWVGALGLDPSVGAEFIELPVVGRGARLVRSFVDGGMRSGIPDTAMRARTFTVYDNVSVVNGPLGLTSSDTIHILVIRKSGEVLLSLSGPATAEGVAAVQAAYLR